MNGIYRIGVFRQVDRGLFVRIAVANQTRLSCLLISRLQALSLVFKVPMFLTPIVNRHPCYLFCLDDPLPIMYMELPW